MERRKKLIEVSMPIDAINAACVREKSIRHGHPSTLHIYWARRPLAAARAVLFGQLIDDPSSRPDLFPTIEEQDEERRRLHRLIERAVLWEATTDQNLIDELKAELNKQFPEGLPTVLDPFAGGGAIPIESARLGLPTEASDLNPLAVLLNKAMIEIPQLFIDQPSLNNSDEFATQSGMGHLALANDVRYYARQLLSRIWERIGHNYPKIEIDGEQRSVIAWIWARTVRNPNPALPVAVPLVKTWVLSSKNGNEAYVKPQIDGSKITFNVILGKSDEESILNGTFHRSGATSIIDGTPIPLPYIKDFASKEGFGYALIAIVVDGPRGRLYLPPDNAQVHASSPKEEGHERVIADQRLSSNTQYSSPPLYGLQSTSRLFTSRQSQFFEVAREELGKLRKELEEAEQGLSERSAAVLTYLSLAFSRTLDYSNNLCSWHSSGEKIRNLFSRQAFSMTWDFTESNPFSSSSGNFLGQAEWVAKAIEKAPIASPSLVKQMDASTRNYSGFVVSTDPPYYDNVGYADLSDFFYPWLRATLTDLHPGLFSTISTPKAEELVADRIRQGSKEAAREFFVTGFKRVFDRMTESRSDVPLAVYYAYKQADQKSDGTSSTGWETMLEGLIAAGYEITGTWPLRTEMANRTRGIGSNALASSIVVVARQRSGQAQVISRRTFVAALREELPAALKNLISSEIAPVDFAQSAIGPGMAVFSRYKFVQESDGSQMSVRDALLLINEILGELLNDQDVEMDPDSRFAMEWYKEYGWNEGSSGIAETLATAKDTSLNNLIRSRVFEAKAGRARLLRPSELAGNWDPATDDRVSIWECVVRLSGILDKDGLERVAAILSKVEARVGLDKVKSMAYFAFYTAEKLGNAKDAGLFNALVSTWGEISSSSSSHFSEHYENTSLFDESLNENEADNVD